MSTIDREKAQANYAVASSGPAVTPSNTEKKTEDLAPQKTESDEKAEVITDETKSGENATQTTEEAGSGAPQADAEESEDGDDDSDQGLSPEEAKEKRKQKWKNRVSKWKSEIQTERERANKAEKALAERNAPAENKEPIKTQPVVDLAEPDPNAEKYIGKYTEYLRDVAKYDRAVEQKAAREEDHHNRVLKTFDERRDNFKKTTKDWDTVINSTDPVAISKLSPQFMFEMTNSETGPQEMYALSKDKALMTKLGTMSPVAQLIELGVIRAGFKQPVAKKEIRINSTPPVVELGGSGNAVHKTLADVKGNDAATYRKMRQAGKK